MLRPHLIATLIITLLTSVVTANVMSLTNTKGKTIQVEVIAINDSTVDILYKNKPINLPLNNLDGASQTKLATLKAKLDAEKAKLDAEVEKIKQAQQAALDNNPLKPGRQHTVSMPKLQNTLNDRAASFTVYVGKNVDLTKPTPILVWFAQATGSNRDGRGHRHALLGSKVDEFIVAAIPFPKSYGDSRGLVRASYAGKTKDLEAYHEPMLQKLKELVPNYDSRLCIAGGFSNGAHTIANHLAHDFKPFTTFFNAFILVDGGASDKTRFAKIKDGSLIFLIGMNGFEKKPQIHYIPKAGKRAGMDVEEVKMEDVGHAFPDKYRASVQKWLLDTVIPKHLKRPLPTTK